jgi:diguanylate cyclase (GGDEF)-like protein
MGSKLPSEKRRKVEHSFTERRSLAFRISRRDAWMKVAAGLALTAMIDALTGDRIWVGPVYMCFLGLSAWALGLREALACLVAVVIVVLFADGGSMYPNQEAVSVWDLMLRIPSAMAIIFLLAHARQACEREWRLARTDPLTGALNRKAFFELAGSIEKSTSWHILAYADLDGLKLLNDVQGHARGDLSLTSFATNVKQTIRKDDIFARIGGDEFLVYLAVPDEASGVSVARRLHRSMNAATREFSDGLLCSVGVIVLAPGPRAIDRELRMADELMYEAKQHGGALNIATASEIGGQLKISRHAPPTSETNSVPPKTEADKEEPSGDPAQLANIVGRPRGIAA